MTFEPIYKKVTKLMQEKGLVTVLSNNFAYNFEHNLSMKLASIKEEFYRKSTASRNYINNLEATTAEI